MWRGRQQELLQYLKMLYQELVLLWSRIGRKNSLALFVSLMVKEAIL